MSGSDAERWRGDEHEVTPLEFFFDLTFVFAMTQVTIVLADDATWARPPGAEYGLWGLSGLM